MSRIKIIAEAGVNHNGSIALAKLLIEAAAAAKVDYVKFQSFKADKLVSKNAKMADYQRQNLQSEGTQYEMLKKLELDDSMHQELINHCNLCGIEFLSTPFDTDSITYLKEKGMKIGKIPSGEITNLPYLRAMAHAFSYIILSTGMCTIAEVEAAANTLYSAGLKKENLTVLHCTTEYPTLMPDVNLKAMKTLADVLDVSTGYSDHTLGIEVPIAAAALGAVVLEKHFTLDRTMSGPDHAASLEPEELKAMVQAVRNIELALGSGLKQPTNTELKNIDIARKSIVAKTDILVGTILTEENLAVKRPGSGISPMLWDNVIGTSAIRDFNTDEAIEL